MSDHVQDGNEIYSHGLRFGCSRCSMCCRFDSGYVWLSERDLDDLSRGLRESRKSVVARYCRSIDVGGLVQLTLDEQPNHDCVFWSDGGCTVYAFRPLQCRSFPFWSHQVFSADAWRESARYCPGIGVGPRHGRKEIEAWLEKRRREPPLDARTLTQ